MGNPLDRFRNNEKERRVMDKWVHYFDIYERHLSHLENEDVSLLEMGVQNGGSLQMWKEYFGNESNIYGIDINEKCKQVEEENIQVFIGDQEDKDFLERLKENELSELDILIDDGGHTPQQRINTFEVLYDHIKEGGIYVCEDMNTSYTSIFGSGGYKHPDTFMEYSKELVDYLNSWFCPDIDVNRYTRTMDSLHYYTGMIIIEKGQVKEEGPEERPFGNIDIFNLKERKYGI